MELARPLPPVFRFTDARRGAARAVPVRRRGPRPTRAMPAAHVSRVRALYRRILLLHRALPPDLKALGDQYVKDEFRRHKAAGPAEARRFLQEWEASGCPRGFAAPRGPGVRSAGAEQVARRCPESSRPVLCPARGERPTPFS